MSRKRCPQCERPVSECYCETLVAIDNDIPLMILQHPSESKHPYNTARIVKQCLSHCTLEQVERIPDKTRAHIQSHNAALLFPDLAWLEKTNDTGEVINLLVVIDGTWKKAKKILHLNPWLQTLPRVALQEPEQSVYRIRKSSMPGGLSTIESVALAMNSLEQTEQYAQLLQPFERMIALAQRYHPEGADNS